MKLTHIFGKPKHVEGVGDIYPIKLKDWDEFETHYQPLFITKKHFQTEDDYPLLDLLVALGLNERKIIDDLEIIFRLSLRVDNVSFTFDGEYYAFIIDETSVIHSGNYDEVRKIIMEQNLLFEPKTYKDQRLQEWANKVLEARRKNAPNVTLEDKISTVAAFNGKHYWDLENYTIYQLESEFARICAIKNYDAQSNFYARDYLDPSKFKLEHFAENLNMFKNPYDDVFKSKDKSKLSSFFNG